MVYFGKKENKEKFEQLEQEIAELQKKVVYAKELNTLRFTRQEIERDKVVKYYSAKIDYNTLDTNVSRVLTIAMNDIPVASQHLVITQFVKRGGNGFIVEIYQYNSNQDITQNLNSANYMISYQKGN